jgi:hypothetical protein
MKSKQFSITVDLGLYERLHAFAAGKRWSVSSAAALLLEAGLDDPGVGESPELTYMGEAAAQEAILFARKVQEEAAQNTALAALGEAGRDEAKSARGKTAPVSPSVVDYALHEPSGPVETTQGKPLAFRPFKPDFKKPVKG